MEGRLKDYGDHLMRTLHLTMSEEGAYRRLLDWWNDKKAPIPNESAFRIARAMTQKERTDVESVLCQFFTQNNDGSWSHLQTEQPQRRSWSQHAYEEVWGRDDSTCRYCGAAGESVDHVVPRCQGGGDDAGNLVVACRSCNSRKGGRTPEQAGMVLQ